MFFCSVSLPKQIASYSHPMQNYLEALFFKAFGGFDRKTFYFLSVIMR